MQILLGKPNAKLQTDKPQKRIEKMKEVEAELARLKQNNDELSLQNDQLKSDLYNLRHNFELHIYTAFQSILQDRRAFYEPGTVTFKLKDGKFSKEVSVDPRDLICVYTPSKGRKKAFILREDVISPAGQFREVYRQYELNSNELNYDEIKKMIDPISSRFVQIAKNTLVNVAYYRFDKKDELIFERELVKQVAFSRFSIKMKESADLFALVKMHWQENYSLHKRITDYRNGESGTGRP